MSDSPALNALVKPCERFRGPVTVPGDKSVSHRVAILASMSRGVSMVSGFLRGEDCLRTLEAMRAMGADFRFRGETLEITGAPALKEPAGALDMGNSGTSMRLLAGIAAGMPWTTEMTGDASLLSRPMRRIKTPLELMGARVELLGGNDRAPMRIAGGRLKPITYNMPVASAQVKSCVLLAGLFAEGETAVCEPCATRDHTELALKAMGAAISSAPDGRVAITGYGLRGPSWEARNWNVPGDFSSAAFWLVAGAGRIGDGVRAERVGLNPRRTALLSVLSRMGADIATRNDAGAGGIEQSGSVTVRPARLRATEIRGDTIPNLIDELPLAAVAGALAEGETVISDAAELRVKESDRIAVMARNLRATGVEAEEKADGMIVRGPADIRGGVEVESEGDHRIAMAMAVLALYAEKPVLIRNVACVATSYPDFWKHMTSLGAEVELNCGD